MTDSLDLKQFYQTFFEEAEELLAEMEQLLLELDAADPDPEHLNAIFRAAHSIKGGAATFGFAALTETTHLLENILDEVRSGEMALRPDMIDIFLETKDVLSSQLESYGQESEPDPEVYERICAVLRQLAEEKQRDGSAAPLSTDMPTGQSGGAEVASSKVGAESVPTSAQSSGGQLAGEARPVTQPVAEPGPTDGEKDGTQRLKITLKNVAPKDLDAVTAEIGQLTRVEGEIQEGSTTTIWVESTVTPEDIIAVCCFVIDADQIAIETLETAAAAPNTAATQPAQDPEPLAQQTQEAADAAEAVAQASPAQQETAPAQIKQRPPSRQSSKSRDSGSLRVGVEKVDQIINLVGELVITQAMLTQTASGLDPVVHDRLLNGLELLERNARDLQEAVMSIRMMQMDYVFSRFPRLVRDQAARLGKRVELIFEGRHTELDKSLIERIIDPLTHLVRNSLDHGIEAPDDRIALGKPAEGRLVLSAEHNGGNIIIEVEDDGAGLNRERIIAKAKSQGIPVNENAPDEDIWQLIFAPGFSTAARVTDLSGRGVGMDVVKRNIQSMGGHVQIYSRPGAGTTTRIILPLTLAILDGMSVRVADEVFILPLSHVTESLQPEPEQLRTLAGSDRVLRVRGEYLPLIELHQIFNVKGAQTDPCQAIAVIMQAEDRRFALLVDHLVGQHQVVVKSLETNYRKVPGVSAATILGDGSVALIVDVFAVARMNRERWQRVSEIAH